MNELRIFGELVDDPSYTPVVVVGEDITAAVRAAGISPLLTETSHLNNDTVNLLFDGLGSTWWQGENQLSAGNETPETLTYVLPDAWEGDALIDVTSYGIDTHGIAGVAKILKFYGRDLKTSKWVLLDECDEDLANVPTETIFTIDPQWKTDSRFGFRAFRLDVYESSKTPGYPAMNELKIYGKRVTDPVYQQAANNAIDVTAAVREAGETPVATSSSYMSDEETVDKIFDGQVALGPYYWQGARELPLGNTESETITYTLPAGWNSKKRVFVTAFAINTQWMNGAVKKFTFSGFNEDKQTWDLLGSYDDKNFASQDDDLVFKVNSNLLTGKVVGYRSFRWDVYESCNDKQPALNEVRIYGALIDASRAGLCVIVR